MGEGSRAVKGTNGEKWNGEKHERSMVVVKSLVGAIVYSVTMLLAPHMSAPLTTRSWHSNRVKPTVKSEHKVRNEMAKHLIVTHCGIRFIIGRLIIISKAGGEWSPGGGELSQTFKDSRNGRAVFWLL